MTIVLVVALMLSVIGVAVVAYTIKSRNPYFRSRDDVERALELPVLASYRASRRR